MKVDPIQGKPFIEMQLLFLIHLIKDRSFSYVSIIITVQSTLKPRIVIPVYPGDPV